MVLSRRPARARTDAADPAVAVAPSPVHGRGLFAVRDLEVDEHVAECPVLRLDEVEGDALAGHRLASYLVAWDEHDVAVPLGVLSFVNHDPAPNAELVVDHDAETVSLRVTAPIAAGDELTVDYGPDHPLEG